MGRDRIWILSLVLGALVWTAPLSADASDDLETVGSDAQEETPPPPEVAFPAIPKTRVYVTNLLGVRVTPIGPENRTQLYYQRRIFEPTSALLQDTFYNVSGRVYINPAFARFGVMTAIQPLALFHIQLGAEYLTYFGTFGVPQSYANLPAVSAFDDAGRDAGIESAYPTTGKHFFIEPSIQLKVGPIAFRSTTALEYWDLNLQGEDRFFYEAGLDGPVANQRWMVSNDTVLLYLSKSKLIGGLFYNMVRPNFTDADWVGAEDPTINYNAQRLGPILLYSFNTVPYSRWSRPSIGLISGVFLSHPYRDYYVAVLFAFRSEFLNRD